MEYVTLNTGAKMPLEGFGVFQVPDPAQCEQAVLDAVAFGYRLIDTAASYMNEEAVGNAIAKCGVSRSELFITTKVNFKSYDNTRTTVENSMKKLQTEYLDMVLLHWPFGNVYGAWRDLEKLLEEGKIRAIGVSNFEPDRLIDLISFNKIKPAINQTETHIYCQRHIEHEWEDKYGVAHQAYAPLGQGRANDMFEEETIKRIADKYGKTPAQVSLRFLLQNNVVIIPKSVHESRMKENIDIFDFELTVNELEAIRALDKRTAMIGNPEAPELVESAMKW